MDKKRWLEKLEALWLAVKWTYQSSPIMSVILLVISVLGGVIVIVEPYAFKLIIDLIAQKPDAKTIGYGLVGIFVVYGVARILKSIWWDITILVRRLINFRIEQHAYHELMRYISNLDMVYFETPEYYNTLSQANTSIWRIQNVFQEFSYGLMELISIAIIIGALFTYNPWLVILVSAAAIPSIVLVLKAGENIWSAFADSSPIYRHADYYKNLLTMQPEAIREIKSFGLREHFLEKYKCLFRDFIKKQDIAGKDQLKWFVLIGAIEGSLAIFAAWLIISDFLKGKITIGDVTFLWALLFQFSEHVRWAVRMTGDMNTDAAFLTPLLKVINFKPNIKELTMPKKFPATIKKGIEFRNVSFYYPKQKKAALKNVNLFIKPNENIALVGENGSGKTTLIKLLCRLYDVSEGEILIDGVNIKDYALDELYANLGVIFQDFMKYEALIEENIKFGRLSITNKKKVHEAAVKAGAWDFIKDLETTYKTHIGKKLKDEGIDLSVGQWQKIALARAFYRDAKILILDEPTSAVDAKAEYDLFRRFKKLTQEKITFLISHRFSTVRMADRIVVIDKGKIQESGSHNELIKKNGRYAYLFKLQAKGYQLNNK